ncbi:hypothetical protein JAO73_13620 [Hymenobacter sp. BT523]|nr:hypothetical protein [Hymenobacter sp. BT523]MBJ6110056.1 hypothetical protein [Hymenobacter sp. BT523]
MSAQPWVADNPPFFFHKLTERYHRAGKTLHLRHLSPDCRQLLSKAGGF